MLKGVSEADKKTQEQNSGTNTFPFHKLKASPSTIRAAERSVPQTLDSNHPSTILLEWDRACSCIHFVEYTGSHVTAALRKGAWLLAGRFK